MAEPAGHGDRALICSAYRSAYHSTMPQTRIGISFRQQPFDWWEDASQRRVSGEVCIVDMDNTRSRTINHREHLERRIVWCGLFYLTGYSAQLANIILNRPSP